MPLLDALKSLHIIHDSPKAPSVGERSGHAPSSTGSATSSVPGIGHHFSFPHPADRLPDFSFAGYAGGAAALPRPQDLRVFLTLPPSPRASDDRTADIQAALDAAGEAGGGVVQLEAGSYALCSSEPIEFRYAGVVLGGDPSVLSGTALRCSGPPRRVFQVGSATSRALAKPQRGRSRIADRYVPLGATSLKLESVQGFRAGQSVSIQRRVTEAWVEAMGMDKLVRGDPPQRQTWLKVGATVEQPREIVTVEDNTIRWAVPLTDPIDSRYAGDTAQVVVIEPPQRVRYCGLENITFVQTPSACSEQVSGNMVVPISFGAAEDCWIRGLHAVGFTEFAKLMRSSRRITMSDFTVHRDQPTSNGGKGALPLDITIEGTQILILRGRTVGMQNTHSYIVSTGSQAHGPNVVAGYQAIGSTRHTIEPHQRWATGLLVEWSTAGQIKMGNRRNMGSGHGWSMGAGATWCCEASRFIIESPPATSRNYQVAPAHGLPVSLYATQLQARLGDDALVANVVGPVTPVRPIDWDTVTKVRR